MDVTDRDVVRVVLVDGEVVDGVLLIIGAGLDDANAVAVGGAEPIPALEVSGFGPAFTSDPERVPSGGGDGRALASPGPAGIDGEVDQVLQPRAGDDRRDRAPGGPVTTSIDDTSSPGKIWSIAQAIQPSPIEL